METAGACPRLSDAAPARGGAMTRYRDWRLTLKILGPVAALLVLIAAGTAAFTYRQQIGQVEAQAARMAHAIALQIAEDRTYYTKNVVGKLQADGLAVTPGDAAFHREKGGIPLPATFVREITTSINARGHYRADLVSPWPINKKQGPRTASSARRWPPWPPIPPPPGRCWCRTPSGPGSSTSPPTAPAPRPA